MKYINKITGIAIETPCAIAGENWIKIESTAKASEKKEKSTAKASEKKEVASVSETKVTEEKPNET